MLQISDYLGKEILAFNWIGFISGAFELFTEGDKRIWVKKKVFGRIQEGGAVIRTSLDRMTEKRCEAMKSFFEGKKIIDISKTKQGDLSVRLSKNGILEIYAQTSGVEGFELIKA